MYSFLSVLQLDITFHLAWMLNSAVERISLEIKSVTTQEVVERWQFKINNEEQSSSNTENKFVLFVETTL